MIQSLRVRLVAGSAISIALALVAIWFTLSNLFTNYVATRYREEMETVIAAIAAKADEAKGSADCAIMLHAEPSDPRFQIPAGGRYWQVTDEKGRFLRSRSLWDQSINVSDKAAPDADGFFHDEGPDGTPILVIRRKLTLDLPNEKMPFTVDVAFAGGEFQDALVAFHQPLRGMFLLTAGVLIAAAFLQGAYSLQPLTGLRRRVSAVRTGEVRSLDVSQPSEVLPLVNEINLLLGEREQAVERARARASDLAHGLKTPLSVLSTLAEQMPPRERHLALQQIDLIRQRSDRQLQSARMGVEQAAQAPLLNLVGKLVAVLSPVTQPKGIQVLLRIDPDLSVPMDPADLAEALGNVLDNATKWAQAQILVTAASARDAHISITVEDDGPGVADDDYARILKRGVSADEATGTGLGLAITADIVEAYGGSITLGRARTGGLAVTLLIPQDGVRRKPKPAA